MKNKLCINKDNPLVPLQSTTPIFVCQMRKSLKLSVRVNSRLVGFYQANGFLFAPVQYSPVQPGTAQYNLVPGLHKLWTVLLS